MTTPFEISDAFTNKWADLSPSSATIEGVPGRDHLNTDFGPEGAAARADLYRSTVSLLDSSDMSEEKERFAAKVLKGFLETEISDYEDGKWRRDLNHIHSPYQRLVDTFEVMPKETPEAWDNVASRLETLGDAIEAYQQALAVGIDVGDVVARRQAEALLEQVEVDASEDSRFRAHIDGASLKQGDSKRLESAVDQARASCGAFADFLRNTYLPLAREADAVGRERYLSGADHFLGLIIDPENTYEWGWSEIHRLRADMIGVAEQVDDSLSVAGVIELLKSDPNRSAGSRQEFVDFISAIQVEAIEQLDGEHFDVPPEIREVTVNMAPPGGSLGAWYHGPSEDFSRPGSIWYAPGERERLPYWGEVTTAYHEGFPGHHLQIGTAVAQRENLSRFHRSVIWYSGSGEGWALYAERLMDELGFFEKPEYRLGLLASQLMRSVRIVIDIGCQLGLSIPEDAPLHAGDVWSYERAVDYMVQVALQAPDMSRSEVTRYLGWYGQAIAYKVGEREIMDLRDRIMSDRGAAFDRKEFHRAVLNAGAIRLDHLHEEVR